MGILFGVIFFVLGLCFGSFVNMMVYRTAVGYKLEKKKFKVIGQKRSFCDYCGEQLGWSENIPIFSWVLLKGRTECCGKKLPLSYPVVELLMGILFLFNSQALIFNDQSSWFLVLLNLAIIVLLVFSMVFDLKYMILPDFSTGILVGSAIVMLILSRELDLEKIIAALVASGFLLILNLVTKGKGMGMGDVKLALFIGLLLGYQKTILAFYIAFIVGAVFGVVLMALKKANKKSQVPFGPFMIFGFLISWWWGDFILKFVNIKLGLW